MAGVAGGQGENGVSLQRSICNAEEDNGWAAAKGDGVTGRGGRAGRAGKTGVKRLRWAQQGWVWARSRRRGAGAARACSQDGLGAQHPAFTGKDLCKNLILIEIVQTLEKRFFLFSLLLLPSLCYISSNRRVEEERGVTWFFPSYLEVWWSVHHARLKMSCIASLKRWNWLKTEYKLSFFLMKIQCEETTVFDDKEKKHL